MARGLNRYQALIEKIFFDHYRSGVEEFEFVREELEKGATELGFARVKNLGDVPYSFRYRNKLPDSILETQPPDREWIILGAGKARYRFKLFRKARIEPREDLAVIDIPDATPELIGHYALNDEQALLAILRYNQLVDIFMSLKTYSLQNHLRTTVQGIGQIEIDELYMGIDTLGRHYAIPVQAKGGKDRIGVVQIIQDIGFVEQHYPGIHCRPLAAQFMPNRVIAMFELALEDDGIEVTDERHYRLVPADRLDPKAVRDYRD